MKKPRGARRANGVVKNNLAIPTFALVGTIIGPESLTAVFGMGTGVSFPVWSPEKVRSTVRCCEPGFGLKCRSGRRRDERSEVRGQEKPRNSFLAPRHTFCSRLV